MLELELMNDENGGQLSSAMRQQKTASELARQRLMETYEAQAPQNYRAPSADSPAPQVQAADWKKYHSAWQDYYQKYYGEYYGRAARDYVMREKMKMEREHADRMRKLQEEGLSTVRISRDEATGRDVVMSVGGDDEEESKKVQDSFRERIRKKTQKNAHRIRHSKHFVPLLSGFVVLVLGLLLQYNQLIVANVVAYMSPNNTEVNEITEIDPTVTAAVHETPTLIIPKINVEVPITFGSQTDVRSMNLAMANGVANFSIPGASAKPGEIGNFVVSGHSAGNVYEASDYKFIFSGLTRMAEGDLIYVDYNGTRYTYRVTSTREVIPTNVQSLIDIVNENPGKPMITLITCTPLGSSKYRLLVAGEQIYPDYTGAVVDNSGAEAEQATESTMPSNHGTPLEQFWNWLIGNGE